MRITLQVPNVPGVTDDPVPSPLRTVKQQNAPIIEVTYYSLGNVRFMGSNLRATHNLAHNVAKLIQQSSLPEPSHWIRKNNGQL